MAMENSIKILGAYGGKGVSASTTCIQISSNSVIDAGNILVGLGEDAKYIDNIFITHSHLDHINDIPFLIDAFFEKRDKPIKVYALKETIRHLNNHIFNWDIWPDFCEIDLIANKEKAIEFVEIKIGETIALDCDTKIKAVNNNHTTSSCGYVITKQNNSVLFTSDTYCCDFIWDEVNENKTINAIIVDVSFPSKFAQLAADSKHLTPKLLKEELKKLKRDDVRVYINHLKPSYEATIKSEISEYSLTLNNGKVLDDGDVISLSNEYLAYNAKKTHVKQKEIDQLIEIGHSLTSETNFATLMEKILLGAKVFSDADGGTLYLMSEDEKRLSFEVVQTDSLNIKMGGTEGEITWPELQLYKEDGTPNKEMVAALCALEGKLINIPDVYDAVGFNFEGTKKFDEGTGYRTKSMLVVPMKNHEDDVIGVLQLLNKRNDKGEIIEFTQEDKKLILSMSSQAAISITNTRLIQGLENLLDAFIKSIATAIDEKSPYTGGHIGRVADLTMLMINAIDKDKGKYKHIKYTPEQKKELRIAAWMHDIGKITTPEYVVDKATKLQTIYDRVNTVKAKFEILRKDKELEFLKKEFATKDEGELQELKVKHQEELVQLDDDLDFIITSNTGGEFMADDKIERIHNIAKNTIVINGEKINLLTENEVENLCIRKGTLTDEERLKINNHALVSIKMLESLPFPKKLRNIPSIAGGHHEKIKGGGYPYGLKGDQISFETRILAIADIFEALTAHDRPYKKANSLNQSMKILSFMVKDGELDADLVKFFVKKGLHLDYANRNLNKEQMDEITVDFEHL